MTNDDRELPVCPRCGYDQLGIVAAWTAEEMRHVVEFDYVIINDDLAQALGNLQSIVSASRLRYPVQRQRHAALFASLL